MTDGLTKTEFTIDCAGEKHVLSIQKDKTLLLRDHSEEDIQATCVARALGSKRPVDCVDYLIVWSAVQNAPGIHMIMADGINLEFLRKMRKHFPGCVFHPPGERCFLRSARTGRAD